MHVLTACFYGNPEPCFSHWSLQPPHTRSSSPTLLRPAGITSVLTTIANKSVLSTWNFDFLCTIMFAQNALTVVVLCAAVLLARFSSNCPSLSFPLLDRQLCLTLLPVSFFYIINVLCGLGALKHTSVPVYQTLKRMSPLPAMVLERLLRGKRFSAAIKLSVGCVCAGALVAGLGDLDLNFLGYGLALMSCVLQALYLVAAARAVDRCGLSTLGVLHYNSLLSMPLLLLGVSQEWRQLLAFPAWGNVRFLAAFSGNLMLGAVLSFSLFLCTLVNSPVTTLIVGNAKAILTSLLGFVLFGRVNVTYLGIIGIVINTAGGILYSLVKYHEGSGKRG